MKKIFAVVILFLTCAAAFGMSKDGHKRVWNETFGFDISSSGKLEKLWNKAQEVIDYYERDYQILKKNFNWFKLNDSGHRLLFHWRFNTVPDKYEPLVSLVKDRLRSSNVPNKSEELKKFWATLNEIDKKRKSALRLSVIQTLGIFDDNVEVIASIIYDLHILADYSTENVSGLPKIDDVKNGLIRSFRNLAGYQPPERIKSLELEFLTDVNSNSGANDKIRAANIIEASKRYLPALMNERFKSRFDKKGIYIRSVSHY